MKKILYSLLIFTLFTHCATLKKTDKKPPNILFIAIDDLRPQLNAYGEKYMYTPHLDELAGEGQLFRNHYVQVPTCGASRYNLLMGLYPQSTSQLSNQVIRDQLDTMKQLGHSPLPQVFKENGYYTACLGKISHYVDGKIYTYGGEGDGRLEMPDSWDTVWGPTAKWGTAWNAFFAYADGSNRNTKQKQVAPTEFVAESDNDLPDGLIAQRAVEELQKLKDQKSPFFLSVGFFKPHLPFVAPKKYWDLYENKDLPISPNPNIPDNGCSQAIHNSGELFGNYQIQPEQGGAGVQLSEEYAMELRRSYFAAVSYVDAQVGRVLAALKKTGLDKNTIVVVWGDHGWHLGEHTIWGKHSLFDRSLRSTLIVKTPDLKKTGIINDAIVETVDLYPTLLDLSNLSSKNQLDGVSLKKILKNPKKQKSQFAVSFWRSGYSIRSSRYRLTQYKQANTNFIELYDHTIDPNESKNIASLPQYEKLIQSLEKRLKDIAPSTFWESLE